MKLKNLSFSLPHKICFEDFNYQILPKSKIAIVGRNGAGKTSLLNMIFEIAKDSNLNPSLVPQIINSNEESGGERFNNALTQALIGSPNVLLLDEPTNHLDLKNRKNLMKMLSRYEGILIIVSHDAELIRNCTNTLFAIDNGTISVFVGNYDEYLEDKKTKLNNVENELRLLNRQKQEFKEKLVASQQKMAKSRQKGEKNLAKKKVDKITGNFHAQNAESTAGARLKSLENSSKNLSLAIEELKIPEFIISKFSIQSKDFKKGNLLIQVNNGSIFYKEEKTILSNINLEIFSGERLAVKGENGSGKSSLIKAIMGFEEIKKQGQWDLLNCEVGYLCQHYTSLEPEETVLETIAKLNIELDIRLYLNNFMFRKTEEVNTKTKALSGGEKARLSLAQITITNPKVLILDEITNNLDIETKQYIANVLHFYQGTIIAISHEVDFLKQINIERIIDVSKWKC